MSERQPISYTLSVLKKDQSKTGIFSKDLQNIKMLTRTILYDIFHGSWISLQDQELSNGFTLTLLIPGEIGDPLSLINTIASSIGYQQAVGLKITLEQTETVAPSLASK